MDRSRSSPPTVLKTAVQAVAVQQLHLHPLLADPACAAVAVAERVDITRLQVPSLRVQPAESLAPMLAVAVHPLEPMAQRLQPVVLVHQQLLPQGPGELKLVLALLLVVLVVLCCLL